MKKSNLLSYTVYIQLDIREKVSKRVFISKKIANKLQEKHRVSIPEVIPCFHNNKDKYLQDTREAHKTDPPTLWFISQTDTCRRLKVVFIPYLTNEYILKTAYPPDSNEESIYKRYGLRSKENERKRY